MLGIVRVTGRQIFSYYFAGHTCKFHGGIVDFICNNDFLSSQLILHWLLGSSIRAHPIDLCFIYSHALWLAQSLAGKSTDQKGTMFISVFWLTVHSTNVYKFILSDDSGKMFLKTIGSRMHSASIDTSLYTEPFPFWDP